MSSPWQVHYSTASGQEACIHELFYCSACANEAVEAGESTANPLRALNVIDVIEDIDAFYCPFSLETFSSQEAMMYFNRSPKCFECPSCSTVLATVHDSTKDEYYFSCSYCRWNSLHLGLVAKRPEALVMDALEKERESPLENKFKDLMNKLREKAGASSYTPKQRHFRSGFGANRSLPLQDSVQRAKMSESWHWEKMEAEIEKQAQKNTLHEVKVGSLFDGGDLNKAAGETDTTENASTLPASKELYGVMEIADVSDVTDLHQRLTQPAEQPVSESKLFPCRKLLLTKRSLRCRTCVNTGLSARPGILLKPQINPLTGDSSMRAKSSWWKKASFASSTVPDITIMRRPDELTFAATGQTDLLLLLTNPTEDDLSVTLSPLSAAECQRQNFACRLTMPEETLDIPGYEDPNLLDDKKPIEASDAVIVYKFNNIIGIKCTIHRLDDKAETISQRVETAFHLRTKLVSGKDTELLTRVRVSLADFGICSRTEAEPPAVVEPLPEI